MPPVLLEKQGAVATIVLNRPGSRNALNLDLATALADTARGLADDPAIRVVILRGEGQAFCGGGDIFSFAEHMDDLAAHIRALLTALHRFLLEMARMPKLTIAAVHGSAAGAGLSLAAMCDLCVAEEDVRFVPAYAKLGVSPDGGGTFGLARAVGTRRALRLFLAERSFSAAEAEAWGLVTRLAAPGEGIAEAQRLAAELAGIAPEAAANTKRLLGRMDGGDLEGHLHDEMESIIRCMDTEGFREAVRSFAAKKAG